MRGGRRRRRSAVSVERASSPSSKKRRPTHQSGSPRQPKGPPVQRQAAPSARGQHEPLSSTGFLYDVDSKRSLRFGISFEILHSFFFAAALNQYQRQRKSRLSVVFIFAFAYLCKSPAEPSKIKRIQQQSKSITQKKITASNRSRKDQQPIRSRISILR